MPSHIARRARVCSLALAAPLTGCMFSPYDGSTVDTRFTPVLFQGYAQSPGVEVRGSIQRTDNAQWDPLFVTYASNTPEYDVSGKAWYLWNTTRPLPTASVYWPKTAPTSSAANIRAAVDGVFAYTFTSSQFSCTVAGVGSKSWIASADDCGVNKTSLTLNAPCDRVDPLTGGCFDTPNFTQLTDFPFDRSMEFSNGLQGVANDGAHWYITSAHRTLSNQLSRIAKVHVSSSLNNQPSYREGDYSPGHKHFGDPVHHNGTVYVPLEVGDGNASEHALGRYTAATMTPLAKLPLSADSPQRTTEFPWIAHNPKNGKFYSSAYTGATGLYEYTLTATNLDYERFIPFGATIQGIQGGEFSPNGRLYLVANTKSGIGGLVTVDMGDPNRAVIINSVQPTWDPDDEELEGLTVWDLDNGQAPGVAGQIHVIMIQPENLSNDDWYFKHFRADIKSKL